MDDSNPFPELRMIHADQYEELFAEIKEECKIP